MNSTTSREIGAALVRAFGREAVSPAILLPDICVESSDGAVVGFVDVAGTRVFVGSPVVRPGADAALKAAELTHRHSRLVLFGCEFGETDPVPDEAFVVGEQPWWDPRQWHYTAEGSRSIRGQLRRASRKGVCVRLCTMEELAPGSGTRRAVDRLIQRWLRSRHMPPLGFVATVDPFSLISDRQVFLAEVAGEPVGVLFAIPIGARRTWLLDHILRTVNAPNGTAELMVDAAMRALAAQGAASVTLGLCPLSGRVPWPLSWVSHLSRGLFDFRGLHGFKSKLAPVRWQRVWVVHPRQTALCATLRILRAFAGGSLLHFALRTALRAPPPLLRLVALLLMPWTLMLARHDASRFFPHPLIWRAWLPFDSGLAAALLWLAQRISRRHRRRWLHKLLAVLVTVDALVTTGQALIWNARRIANVADAIVVTLACLAPTLVAVVLWSSLRFRET